MEDREARLKEIDKPDKQNSCEIWIDINHTLKFWRAELCLFSCFVFMLLAKTKPELLWEKVFLVPLRAFITRYLTGNLVHNLNN